jgi:uncharacterized membrane protein YfcA
MDIAYLIITGMFVGFLSSFFGIGGGSLIMPILFMLYPEVPAQAIIPSSLGVIFLNSLINNYNFFKEDLSPSKNTIFNFALTCSIGAAIGAITLHYIDSQMVKKAFGIIMLLIAAKVLLSKTQNQESKLIENQTKLALTGVFGSFISSVTGLGGGIVFVPMLASYIKLPLVYISSFSNVAMSFATFIGVIPHFFYQYQSNTNAFYSKLFVGHVNFMFILCIFSGAVFTSKLGAKMNTKIDFKVKKNLLALLLIIFGIKTVI